MSVRLRRWFGLAACGALLLGTASSARAEHLREVGGILRLPALTLEPELVISGLPFDILGGGFVMTAHVPRLLHVTATAHWGYGPFDPYGQLSAYAGIPLWSWRGSTSGRSAVSQESTGYGTRVGYVETSHPTADTIVAEVGAVSGSANILVTSADVGPARLPQEYAMGFSSTPPDATVLFERPSRLTFPCAGLRYAYGWNQGGDRGTFVAWAHVVGKPLGLPPSPDGSYFMGFIPQRHVVGPVGFKAGVRFPTVWIWFSKYLNAPLYWDIELGVLPTGETSGRFGITFPLWIL